MRGALVAVSLAAILAILLAGDVRGDELLRVAAFQALFVLGPGLWMVATFDLPNAAMRWGAAWTLGSIAAATIFLAGGAVGLHSLVWILPVLTVVAAVRSRTRRRRPALPATRVLVGVVLLCAAGSALIWLNLFGQNPLMRGLGSGSHYHDLVFHLALAGEVLHHALPFEDPSVAGEALRYQLLPHLDAAAAGYVTGVELEVLLWRTQPVLATAAAAALAGGLACRYGGGPLAGLLGAVLLLLGGEVDLTVAATDFRNRALLTTDLLSPTQLFAVPTLLTLMGSLFAVPRRWSGRALALFVLLGFGAMAAKVTVVPVLAGGFFFAWLLARQRRDLRALAPAAMALLGGAAVAYALLYVGSRGNGLAFDPLELVGGEGAKAVARTAFVPFVALAAAGGMLTYVALRRPSRDAWIVWVPVGALAASLVAYLALDHPGKSQIYFLRTGLAAAAPLSGAGVALALRRANSLPSLMVAAVGGVAAMVVGSRVARHAGDPEGWAAAALMVIVAAAVAARGRARTAVAIAGVVLAGLSLTDPFIDSSELARTQLRGDTLVRMDDAAGDRGITEPVRDALVWLRDHSDPSDVLAVNNTDLTDDGDPRYFYYAAIAERRVFLQGWAYSDRAAVLVRAGRVSEAFPQRVTLNDAAFDSNVDALRELAHDHDVRFLVVDRRYGPDPPESPMLRRVYQSDQAGVYELFLRAE